MLVSIGVGFNGIIITGLQVLNLNGKACFEESSESSTKEGQSAANTGGFADH